MSLAGQVLSRLGLGAGAEQLRPISGPVPSQLQLLLPDSWPGDAQVGMQLLAGERGLFDTRLLAGDPPQWLPPRGDARALAALHGFEWLRDLRTLGSDQARLRAQLLVLDWITRQEHWPAAIWAPALVGLRLANWVQHYEFLTLRDDTMRAPLCASLLRQARHLDRLLPGHQLGWPQWLGWRGLLLAGLALPGEEKMAAAALDGLLAALATDLYADGMVRDRSPAALLLGTRLLIDCRNALAAARVTVPPLLAGALERMASALRVLRHGDGGLSVLQASNEETPLVLDLVLNQAEVRGRVRTRLAESGFERIHANRTLLLFDAGPPPARPYDRGATAGLLGLELSIGRERLLTSCGGLPALALGPIEGGWRQALAATAASSTVTVAETNALEIQSTGGLARRPRDMWVRRIEQPDGIVLDAQHDAYRPAFGITHRRSLWLRSDGEELRGEDRLEADASLSAPLYACARFHLHPLVTVSLIQNGRAALLRLGSGLGFRLLAESGTLSIEESLYLGGNSQRRTHQLVVGEMLRGAQLALRWQLVREK